MRKRYFFFWEELLYFFVVIDIVEFDVLSRRFFKLGFLLGIYVYFVV